MADNRHYHTTADLTEDIVNSGFDHETHVPEKAWIRIGKDEYFSAKNFKIYVREQPHTASDLQPHGRVYMAYPNGFVFTALLENHPELIRKIQAPNLRKKNIGKICFRCT